MSVSSVCVWGGRGRRVEAQELKLKKLRALRGQVDQYKASNSNLSEVLSVSSTSLS